MPLAGEIANKTCSDIQAAKAGAEFPELEKLASQNICDGRWPSFKNIMAAECDLPEPEIVEMPWKSGPANTGILLPHAVSAAMYNNPEAWKKHVLPNETKLEELWDCLGGHPMLLEHTVKSKRDYKTRCVILGLHGD